jgi:hypothetical protein
MTKPHPTPDARIKDLVEIIEPECRPNGEAKPNGADTELPEGVRLEDFVTYMPMHGYIFMPAREMWPAGSVNARLPLVPLFKKNGEPLLNKEGEQKYMAPSTWLDKNAPVEQMTWHPGLPELTRPYMLRSTAKHSSATWTKNQIASIFRQKER